MTASLLPLTAERQDRLLALLQQDGAEPLFLREALQVCREAVGVPDAGDAVTRPTLTRADHLRTPLGVAAGDDGHRSGRRRSAPGGTCDGSGACQEKEGSHHRPPKYCATAPRESGVSPSAA